MRNPGRIPALVATTALLTLGTASMGHASACAGLAIEAAAQATQVDQQALRADIQRSIERRRRELLPEYERRVRTDGRASADDWLRARAAELGRRDGEAIRRGHQRGNYDADARNAGGGTVRGTGAGDTDAQARHRRGDPSCARLVTRNRAVANVSGGPMQMIMVTECLPAR